MSEQWKSIRNSFFTGLLIVFPIGASIGLIWWVVTLMTAWLPVGFDSPLWRVAAVMFLVVVTILVGMLTRKVAGKRLIGFGEELIQLTPVLNKIYPFMKEISQTMLAGQKTMFQRVVLVDLTGAGVYSLAFVTNEKEWEAQAKTGQPLVNVFLVASPPTHGYALAVPRERVVEMEMTVAEGMKMMISGGTVVPPYTPGKPK